VSVDLSRPRLFDPSHMRSPAITFLTFFAFAQATLFHDVSAVASASSGELLAAELPPGLTISAASTPVLAQAVRTSITKRTDMAVPILRVALLSRAKKRLDGSKGMAKTGDRSKGKTGWSGLDPADVLDLTRAAIDAAPDQAQALINEAIAISPENADSLQGLVDPGAAPGGAPGGVLPIRIPDLHGGMEPIPGGSQSVNPGNSSGPLIIISPER
jgi:hypothetical protein